MRKLLNTLFITSPEAYLSLSDNNIQVSLPEGDKYFPLHMLEGIVCFTYKGASPALLGYCSEQGIRFSFYTPEGKYLCSVDSENTGNVLLRREQYHIADDERAIEIARNMVIGKIYNSKYILLRCIRDHEARVDVLLLREAADNCQKAMLNARGAENVDTLRGIEGNAASVYFNVFNEMILLKKDGFSFSGRNRRPPLDPVNALLSFAYSLLANDCAAALRSVGLDPYVGFMHTDRPGRMSLALDLLEELRAPFADRFVLTLINNRMVTLSDINIQDNGAVLLAPSGRKLFLSEWQKKKREEITHPYLEEKIAWGLVPYVQALLLARTIRGDLDGYPAFLWK